MPKLPTFAGNFGNMFHDNLKYLRMNSKKAQSEIAQDLGISRSTWGDYENGKSEPIASVLKKIGSYFGVSLDDLLSTNLRLPLKMETPANLNNENIRVLAISVDKYQKENIEFVPYQAAAGYAQNYANTTYIENLPRFNLPKLAEGTHRAFEVVGNSMPPIDNGFIVIGKYVEHYQDLKQGKRYILALKDGIVFKRLAFESEKNRRLILISDNVSDYPPFTIRVEDILEAWEMVSFIGYDDYKKIGYSI